MIDLYIVYENTDNLNRLYESDFDVHEQIFIHAYNINKKSDRSAGFKLKSSWGAKENPFIYLEKDGKPLKCFYSESSYEYGNDVINQVIKYLNDEKN